MTSQNLPLESTLRVLKQVEIFIHVPTSVMEEIAGQIHISVFQPEEVIINKGDKGNSMYIIFSGQVKVHCPEDLFRDAPEHKEFAALSAKWFELSDFLVNVLKVDRVPGTYAGNITYHDSCAGLREIAVKMQPRYLLQMAGAGIVEMAECEKCCGFGGTFSVKLGEISTRMAENKCANIRASGARAIVGGDLGCLLNIEGRLRREGDRDTRVLHFAEVIAGMPD